MSSKSINATKNIRSLADEYLKNDYSLEIVDVSKDRQQAISNKLIGLPTLIRVDPKPSRIIVGDLSEKEKVLKILNIQVQ